MDSAATELAGGPDKTGPAAGGTAEHAGAPVLHRLIAARGSNRTPSTSQAPVEFRIERAAATALGRAAERQARLPVFVEKVELARMTLPELPEILPERALLAVIEGHRDAIGVAAICPDLLASLIEMQAIGRVTARPAPARKPTRTDASISADFINALLGELARECQGQDTPHFGSFRYATYMDDTRPLSLMLEDGEMVRLTIRFRMGPGGQRDATLVIVLPLDKETRLHPEGAMTVAGAKLPVSPAPAAAKPAASLAAVVQQTPVAVIGILCRRKVSLQTLRNLVPGALLQLPHNVLDDARIETPRGQLLARGRLGEAEGLHAIRLRDVAQETAAARPQPAPWPTSTLAPGDIPVTRNPEPPMQDVYEADPFRSTGAGAGAGEAAAPIRFAG